MARPKIQFQLQQPNLRPVASPVDTYVQPNPVPPEEAVTNQWLNIAKGLAELSPGLTEFLEGVEDKTKKKSVAEAQAAMDAFEGEASIFKTLPRTTGKEAEAWFKANKDAFGGSEFRYAGRPDFQLAFQVAQGRYEVNKNKRFTLEDGTPVTYRDYLYAHADELSDPNSDARAKVDEWRQEFFEGLDPTKSIAYREGVISAAAPMESQFLNTIEARQVAAAEALTRQASVDELMGQFDKHRQGNVSVLESPAVEGETAAEAARREEKNQKIRDDNAAREAALQQGIVNILEGPQFIGGISKNKVLFEALDTMARVTQADTEDDLEAEEFLEWAKGLPGLGTAYWQGKFEEIQSNIEIRERQRGKDDGLSTLPEVRNQANWMAYGMLKEGDPVALDGALAILRQPENQARFEALLKDNKLNESELEALIGGAAESFMGRKTGTGYPTSKEGQTLLEELTRSIAINGATAENRTMLESPETQELLGGTVPGGAWERAYSALQAKEEKGFSDREVQQRASVSFGRVIPPGERNQYSPGDQALIEELEQDFREEYEARIEDVEDPAKRREIAQTLMREFQNRKDILELQERNYRVAPGLLYDKGLPVVRAAVDSAIEAMFPLTEDIVNQADPSQTRRNVPVKGAALRQQEAQIDIKLKVQPYIRVLSEYLDDKGVTDISRRNAFITEKLVKGFDDPESGLRIPSLRQTMERYEAGEPEVTTAPSAEPVIGQATQEEASTIRVQRSERMVSALRPINETDAKNLGASRLPNSVSEMDDWSVGTIFLWSSNERDPGLGKTETFRKRLQSVHSYPLRQVGRVSSAFGGRGYRQFVELDMHKYYPSPNDMVLIYASNLMLDPTAKQPTRWYGDGDFMSDIGVDFNQYADNPANIRQKYLAAKVNKGLTVGELRLGRTREGIRLDQFLPADPSMWPLSAMLIGPQEPKAFAKYIEDYRSADDKSTTDLGFVMEFLGITDDQPMSATDSTTHGEKFIANLEMLMQQRVESLEGQSYRLHMNYRDFPRMLMRKPGLHDAIVFPRDGSKLDATASRLVEESKRISDEDADDRYYSPAVRNALENERQFLLDLKRLKTK